jgi:hypothetical protein
MDGCSIADVTTLPPLRDSFRHATQRQIVGFRASGGEYDFVGCTSNQFGDLLSRGIDRGMSAAAKRMAAGWIAPVLCADTAASPRRPPAHRRGCVVIEINRFVRVHENPVPALLRSLGVDSTLMRPPLHRKRPGLLPCGHRMAGIHSESVQACGGCFHG